MMNVWKDWLVFMGLSKTTTPTVDKYYLYQSSAWIKDRRITSIKPYIVAHPTATDPVEFNRHILSVLNPWVRNVARVQWELVGVLTVPIH
jgi:hypothetical protein